MAVGSSRETPREGVKARRRRMREQGMRLVQIWVPDTRSPAFAAEAARQSKLIAASPQEADDQAFINSISVFFNEHD